MVVHVNLLQMGEENAGKLLELNPIKLLFLNYVNTLEEFNTMFLNCIHH